ncbi:hypothetical protein [Chitinolyticbacter meiyuanensis]|uniref:hypothetical protein n=1 Tax=Chitinolyticbacter meiyuanensis TaxID=682798 RepID=UPI0011E5D52B|nr:hypothetical protein [Chitinolyticbacter meiyuanensis]
MMTELNQLLERARKIVRSQSAEAMALATQAGELARAASDAQGESLALTIYAHGYFMFGRSQEAKDTLLQALVIGEGRDIGTARGEALQLIARVAYTLGEYERAADCWCACTELDRSQVRMAERIQAHIGLGQLCYAHDHYELALAHHRRAAELAEADDDPHLTSTSLLNIAADLIGLQRCGEAADALKQALPLVRADQNYQFEAEIFSLFGQIRLIAGEIEAARMSLMVALKINRLHINTWGESSVLLRLAQCSLAAEEVEMATEQLARARALAEAMGSTPLLADIHAALSRLAELQQEPAVANEHREQAAALRQQLRASADSPRYATLELRLAPD